MDPRPVVLERKLFQVALSNEQLEERLNITEPYSTRFSETELANCANLTLVLLGIVTAKDYLSVCTKRTEGTAEAEVEEFIADALRKCGKNAKVETYPYKADISRLNALIKGLLPGYATNLTLIHPDRKFYHEVLLYKDKCNQLFLIDAQVGEDRLYPEQAIGLNRILKYIKHDGYTAFRFVGTADGGLIHENEVAKCTTDRVPGQPVKIDLPKPVTEPAPKPTSEIVWKKPEPAPPTSWLTVPASKPAPTATSAYTAPAVPEKKDPANREPLIAAILSKKQEDVSRLSSQVDTLNYTTDGTLTPLIALVQTGTGSTVRQLVQQFVKKGADVNYQNAMGNTVLIESLKRPSIEMVNLLCKLGANANLENKQGQSALDIAKIRKIPKEIITDLNYCGRNRGGKTRRAHKNGTRRRRR